MSLPQTPKNIVSLKSIRNVPTPDYYASDVYERLAFTHISLSYYYTFFLIYIVFLIIFVFRLQSKSLHTIEELKEICKTLFLTIHEQAKADYEQIFKLEQELRSNPFLEVRTYHILSPF